MHVYRDICSGPPHGTVRERVRVRVSRRLRWESDRDPVSAGSIRQQISDCTAPLLLCTGRIIHLVQARARERERERERPYQISVG